MPVSISKETATSLFSFIATPLHLLFPNVLPSNDGSIELYHSIDPEKFIPNMTAFDGLVNKFVPHRIICSEFAVCASSLST